MMMKVEIILQGSELKIKDLSTALAVLCFDNATEIKFKEVQEKADETELIIPTIRKGEFL